MRWDPEVFRVPEGSMGFPDLLEYLALKDLPDPRGMRDLLDPQDPLV